MPTLSTIGAACARAWGFTSGLVKDQYFNLVSLLLPGNGTNGAQNNTFLDSSTNNFTITRNGNTTQGTFSPFSQTGWGNYFDGTANGSLRADSSTDTNLSGDFTIQAWIYPTANGQSSNSEIISRGAATTLNGWHFGLFTSTTQLYFGLNYASSGNTSTSTQSSTNLSLNQWTHVAVTRSGNTCRIYINGVVDTTNTGFTGTPTVSGTEYVYVGRGSYDSTNRQFTGYINNASIIKGTALTTFSQTQPLATGTSGQALLTCTANRFIDTNTATTAKTLTAGSGASVVAFSPFAPTAAYTTAAVGGSGYFDGTGDFLSATNASALQLTSSTAFTIEFWWYPTSLAAQQYVQSAWVVGSTGYAIATGVSSFTVSELAFFDGTTWRKIGNPVLNAWNHIAIVSSGTSNTGYLYLNGSPSAAFTVASTINYTSGTWYLGQNSSSGAYANGYVTDFRLLKGTNLYPSGTAFTPPTAPLTAITNTSLLLNFTNAGITDATAKNDLETVGNAQISTTQSKWGGGSMYFDGTGDYLQAPISPNNDVANGNFTIEAWIYPTSTTGGSEKTIVSTYTNGYIFYIKSSDGRLQFDKYGVSTIITGSTAITANVWTYVAVTRSGNTWYIFINGTQDATATSSTTFSNTSTLRIADSGSGTQTFYGYIDDLRITKGYARYTANFTAPTAPFPVQ